ncbi:Ig-like domain-containing protein [Brevibacillus panacihumi]|uniref:Ig-like domain-containing protein n=2 Tax=Brevibacillus panacihumi TaxID=497735 RepID=UPI003CFC95E0
MTDANGQADFTVTHTRAQVVNYTAVVAGSNVTLPSVQITFEAGATDSTMSTLQASPTRVVADGTSTSTLTVHLKDQHGNGIAGHDVSLSQGSGRSTIAPATATTDANGIAAFRVSSRTAEKVTYSAKDLDENLTLAQTAQITFTSRYVPPPYYPVQSVSLDRDSLAFTEGDPAVKLHAVIQPSYASNQQVRWESSDPDVAIVDQTGTVTPKAAGTAVITVTTVDGNKTASAQVTVEPVAEENKLLRIEASQSSLFLLLGDSAAFQVKAVYEDGTEEHITKDKKTVYKSSARSIASVKPGQIKAGNKDGDAIITISYEGESTEIEVTVSSADVQSIRPSFRQVVLEEDEQREIELVATLSDRKKIEVGSSAEWMVDDPKIVSVDNGNVTALAKGKTRITVSYGDLSYRIAVTVVDEKKLLKLKVSNQSLHLEQDEHMRLTVKGVYEDGHEVDVSEDVTWQVHDKDIAVVKKGEVIALAPGRTTVTAAYAGKKVSMSISVIEERILERLSSNKNFVKLSVDNEQSITLNALYNDRTKADVSDEAKWTSSDEGIAVVKDGVITAISSGEVEIIAEYEGKTVTIYVTVTK